MVPDHTYLTWSTHSNLSRSRQHRWTESLFPTQSTTRWLTDPRIRTQFLSRANHWSSGGKATLCWHQTTRLTGPITPTCDRYVQYLLMWANSSVLNWHRRGLQPCRCRLANTTPWPSQPTVLHFLPNGPTQSQVKQVLPTKPEFQF
jgi:hypothetical protein